MDKKIIYKENLILQSLYKAATDEKIPANIIIEFARIYGFQVDFQRDIRKQDKFQIMYEIFLNDKNEIIETGEILFANLKLSGQDNGASVQLNTNFPDVMSTCPPPKLTAKIPLSTDLIISS